MALRHAIIEATVPSSNGNVDYTAPGITTWDTDGLALVFICGDTGDLTLGGFFSIGACDFSGSQTCSGMNSVDAATGLPENKQADITDHVGILLDNTGGTSWGSWARVAFNAALPDGVRLNWTDTSGVGSRVFKVVVVLLQGFSNVRAQSNSSFVHGFQSDALLVFPNGNGSSGSWAPAGRNANEVCPGLGGALRLGGVPQLSSYVVADRNSDPLVCRGRRSTSGAFSSSTGNAENLGTVSAFNAASVSTTGTTRGMHVAMASAGGPSDFKIAHEELDGSTGVVPLTGLGARCNLVLGFLSALSSDDTFEADAAALAGFAFFVTDGRTTISLGFAQRHTGTAITAGNPTDTYSSYSNGSIRMLDHLNATAFQATVRRLTSSGLELQVSTGIVGTMTLFGFATTPVVEFPDAAPIGCNVPAVTVIGFQTPTPVQLGLVPGSPMLLIPQAPSPAILGLLVPDVLQLETSVPSVIQPTPPPPLGDFYGRALLDLLPRGLAWTRDPETVLGRLLRAFAEECGRIEFRGRDLVRESDARQTHELLAEWEEWLRTRLECPDLGATDEERRFALLVRLVEPGGQNAFHYSQVAQRLGFAVKVEDFEEAREFRVGISAVGDALYSEDWRFVVIVHAPTMTPVYFRAGLSSAGEPLTTGGNDRLPCELDRIRPAHVLFLYSFDKPFVGYAPWNIIGPAPARVGLVVPIPKVLL